MRTIIVAASTIALVCLFAGSASAQIEGLSKIELAKRLPPSAMTEHRIKENLSAIKWQAEQLANIELRYRTSLSLTSDRIEAIRQQIEKMSEQMPGEVRLLDNSNRSRLIGKAMEELLMAKLDLATKSAAVGVLEKRASAKTFSDTPSKSEEAAKKEIAKHTAKQEHAKLKLALLDDGEIELEAALKKYEVSKIEYENTKKLAKIGSKSVSELTNAKYTAEVAELEYSAALQNKNKKQAEIALHIAASKKQRPNKSDSQENPEGELTLMASRIKLEAAKENLARTRKLAEKGYVSKSELKKEEYAYAIAEVEMASAQKQIQIENNKSKANNADLLSLSRVEIEPIKARIAAAEKFLKTLSAASETMARIEVLRMEAKNFETDSALIRNELSKIKFKIAELGALTQTIEAALAKKMAQQPDKNATDPSADEK